MANKPLKSKGYEEDAEALAHSYEAIPSVVKRLMTSISRDDRFNNAGPVSVPFQESVIQIIYQARRLLFPGFFLQTRPDPVNLEYSLGQEAIALLESLSKQIALSMQHDCLRFDQPCRQCTERSYDSALKFIQTLPELSAILTTDTSAALEGDPAAKSYEEVVFSYPGLFAITVFRMAHRLYELGVPILPRMMTEYAHSLTGIDIHPGAKIGESFFIDHGTGVVVGETTEIGSRVRLYQGVTLGALSFPRDEVDSYRNKKRHPTIEDDVIIYSNTTVLGGKTVIGARSIIGGNVWITESVEPDTKVLLKRPELVYVGNHDKSGATRREEG